MTISITLASQIAAAAPVLAYIAFIWWLDRYEREPLGWVAFTFLYGASGGIFLGAAGSILLMRQFGITDPLVTAGVLAPITEEPAKGLVLLFLIAFTRQFDNTTDGLVYGAATGLGFAMTENYLYFKKAYESGGAEAWTQVVVLRSAFTALMHSVASATFGAVMGYYRYRSRRKQWIVAPVIGFVLSMGIHAAFNSALVKSSASGNEELAHMALGLVPLLGLVLFVVTMISLIREHRMIEQELREEAEAGYLPAAHAASIPYWTKRWRKGWLPEKVNRKKYVRTATLLAFRKHQAKRRTVPPKRLAADIEKLRAKLREMLSQAA